VVVALPVAIPNDPLAPVAVVDAAVRTATDPVVEPAAELVPEMSVSTPPALRPWPAAIRTVLPVPEKDAPALRIMLPAWPLLELPEVT
jgi:hypothetical protein